MRLLLVLALPLLVGATCQKVPDFLVCADLPDEGHCRRYISKKLEKYDNDKKLYRSKVTGKVYTWTTLPKVSLPADEFKVLKTFFDSHCHNYPSACNSQVGDWNTVSDEILRKLEGK